MAMYRITWKSETGVKSHGEPVFRTLEECQAACKKADTKYPTIKHFAEAT